MTTTLTPVKPTRDHSGHYMISGVKCMAVADIVRAAIPRPDKDEWVANEVARCAVDALPQLCRFRGDRARERSIRWLRQAADQRMRDAMRTGREVHRMIESHLLERPAPSPSAELAPYLKAWRNFLIDHDPAFEATELLLANPAERYAGKADAWAVLPELGPDGLLIDWQTGNGVYPETALRLAAFRRATMAWTMDGVAVGPPAMESAIVVHLRPEKYRRGYALIPVNTSDAVFEVFRAARDTSMDWVNGLSATVIGVPL